MSDTVPTNAEQLEKLVNKFTAADLRQLIDIQIKLKAERDQLTLRIDNLQVLCEMISKRTKG